MNKLINICLLFILLLLSSCANSKPPSGGPGKKDPPKVTQYTPKSNTLNFDTKSIEIEFSEFMNKSKVNENIFISPSAKMTYDWSGTDLEIEFTDTLDANTTYALTIGTDYADYYGNKPSQAFTLVFSTGNTLDSGAIKGMLHADKPSGMFIYAYRIDNIDPDTLNVKHTKPKYRTQVGTNGQFKISALRAGTYRVFAIKDKFKDEIYDEGIDAFGAATKDVVVSDTTTPFLNIKQVDVADIQAPMLLNVEPLDSRNLIAGFSKAIDSKTVHAENIVLTDSNETIKMEILSAYLIKDKYLSKIKILTKSALDTNSRWKLTTNAIQDSSANTISDSARTAYFKAITGLDTLLPALDNTPFKDSTKSIKVDKVFTYAFNTPIDKQQFEKRIKFKHQDSLDVPYHLTWIADNAFELKPQDTLKGDTWYSIAINMNKLTSLLDIAMPDSISRLRFKTEDVRDYANVSATVKDSTTCTGQKIIIIQSTTERKNHRQKFLNKNGKLQFKKLKASTYTFSAFCDLDNDRKYSSGSAFPFKHSEPFYKIQKEINVRKRWDIDDILLIINDLK